MANITVSDSRILCITAVPSGEDSGPGDLEGEGEEGEGRVCGEGGEEVDGGGRRQGGREMKECVGMSDGGEGLVLSSLDKVLMEEEQRGEEGSERRGREEDRQRKERGEEEEEEGEEEEEEEERERWKKHAVKEGEGQGSDRHGNKKTLFRYVQSKRSRREVDGSSATTGEETLEMMVRFTRDPSEVDRGGGGGGGGGGGRGGGGGGGGGSRERRVVHRQLSVSDAEKGREEEEEEDKEEGGEQKDLASENMMSVSVSLLSESQLEDQTLPERSQAGAQENFSQDPSHSLLAHRESDSMSQSPCGSIAVSSSDSSSEISRLSISRTPSMTSTRSEPRSTPNEIDGATDIVGGASGMLDTIPAGGGFSTEEDIRSSRKNGFRRVRSNSAPDLLKAAASLNPSVSPSEAFPMGKERAVTSLSPPASGSKFWSPLTLRPPQSSAKEEEKESVEGNSMWLGTEGGQILIYSPGSNLRSRSSRTLLQLPSAVHCIR